LANALGETVPHEVIPVVSAPQQFNIATPRERSPRGRGRGRGGKNTVSGALAAIAAEKQIVPENVDAGIAPIAGRKPRLTADQRLDILIQQTRVERQAGRLAIQDGEPDAKKSRRKGQLTLNEVGIKGSAQKVINKLELKGKDVSKQTKLKEAFAKGAKPKTIALQDAPTTEKAPKLANESSTEEVKGNSTEMPLWSKLNKKEIVDNILKMFEDDKSVKSLMAMTKANLLIYVQSKGSVDKLVKTPTTTKPTKGRAQGRNKGVKA
jgi:hypothetical protein